MAPILKLPRMFQLLVTLGVLLPSSLHADIVFLKTGAQREGQIIEITDERVVLRDPVTGGDNTYRRSDIDRVERTGTGGAAADPDSAIRASINAAAAGNPAEAYKVLLDAAKVLPANAPQLGQQFSKVFYDHVAKAQQKRATDAEGAYGEYASIQRALQDPAAKTLIPAFYDQVVQRTSAELADAAYRFAAQKLQSQSPDDQARGRELVAEAARIQPGNPAYRLAMGQIALQTGDFAAAQENLNAALGSQSATPEQKQSAQNLLAQLQSRAPARTPTPAPTVAAATPAPRLTPVPQTPTPVPGVQPQAQPTPATNGGQKDWKSMITNMRWGEMLDEAKGWFDSAMQSGLVVPIVATVVVLGLLWLIPAWFLKVRAGRGDVIAAEHRLMARRVGILALIPYTVKSLKAGPPKNRCPFCNKGIDNIDQYADLNFVGCPFCGEHITPIYSLKDYITHLVQQVEMEARRSKGGAEAMVEKDAMSKLIRAVLTMAVRRRASDLHVDTETEGTKVRARIDGVMYELLSFPRSIVNAFISAIKIMAELDITERRVPQDGKVSMWIDKNDIDLRLNTSPAALGEKVSIRILNQKQITVDPTKLGIDGENLEKYERAIHRPHGLIIVTGPSGSGKSTTLYVALNEINTGEKNIVTIEDPIEYQLKGISQMQVNPAANFTFATGLRSILRQDPDIIMVGEIRDKETAVIAVEAAMTGHLVFTTLHTIDAPTAFSRLTDLDVDTRRLAESIVCILGQRLVRTICPDCRQPYKPKKADLDVLGLSGSRDITFVHGGGVRHLHEHRLPGTHGTV
jgi:type II secretory ATPase GspE/PulE/Tfp pilus assembly ATPase PilB-like protein